MGCHDHICSLVNTCLEGNQITVLYRFQIKLRAGQMGMAVLSHIAMTGEMLECRCYAGRVKTLDESCHVFRRGLRIIRE